MQDNYKLILKTAPTLEILTLAKIKKWCRISSYLPSADKTPKSTIAPGSHAIGTTTGTAYDISGYNAYFTIDSRSNGVNGTVTLTIMESNNNTTFTAWTGGSFAVITEANDNQFFSLDYTGNKRYLRIDAVVAGAACEFGANIILDSPVCDEDDVLTDIRKMVREAAEQHQGRAYMPQTWQLYLDEWPCKDYIDLRISPVRSITSITYITSDGTTETVDSDTYFLSESYQKESAKVYLNYGEIWPNDALQPYEGIIVEFEAGYADLTTYQQYLNTRVDNWMYAACAWCYKNRDLPLEPKNFSFRALDFDSIRVPFA